MELDDFFEPLPEWMFGDSVEARNALQQSGRVHPYTCGNDDCRHKTNGKPLLAVEGGWLCDDCGYTQPLQAIVKVEIGEAARGPKELQPLMAALVEKGSAATPEDIKNLREQMEALAASRKASR